MSAKLRSLVGYSILVGDIPVLDLLLFIGSITAPFLIMGRVTYIHHYVR